MLSGTGTSGNIQVDNDREWSLDDNYFAGFALPGSLDEDPCTPAQFWFSLVDQTAQMLANEDLPLTPPGPATYARFRLMVDGEREVNIEGNITSLMLAASESLSIGSLNVAPNRLRVGVGATASATFSAANCDTHTATWNWGDGTESPGLVDEAGQTVQGTHVYTTAGLYAVTLTLTGCSPDSPEQATFDNLVVYDPAAGFVLGAGWIHSPAGAYAAKPALTGTGTFALAAKYLRGARVPAGSTEFRLQPGGPVFRSLSYDWLVVTAGNHAQLAGNGLINGRLPCRFMVWAHEGRPATFRIRIWAADAGGNEVVIYDNGTEQPVCGAIAVLPCY